MKIKQAKAPRKNAPRTKSRKAQKKESDKPVLYPDDEAGEHFIYDVHERTYIEEKAPDDDILDLEEEEERR